MKSTTCPHCGLPVLLVPDAEPWSRRTYLLNPEPARGNVRLTADGRATFLWLDQRWAAVRAGEALYTLHLNVCQGVPWPNPTADEPPPMVMSRDELRAYLADPAKSKSPAVLAARALFDERDRLARELGRRRDLETRIDALSRELADREREVARLRDEQERRTPNPWELPRDRDTDAA